MSLLSKNIARWIQTNPGAFRAPTEDAVFEMVLARYIHDARWREPVDINIFRQHLSSIGYRVEIRHDAESKPYAILALPEKPRGF